MGCPAAEYQHRLLERADPPKSLLSVCVCVCVCAGAGAARVTRAKGVTPRFKMRCLLRPLQQSTGM